MHRQSAFLGGLLAMVMAVPATAAAPIHFKIDISDPSWEASVGAALSAECGFAITMEGRGHINVIVFDPPRGRSPMVEIDTYAMHEIFSANGKSLTVNVDAGPDLYRFDRAGHLILTLTGRAVTGSGVIGRFSIDLDTDEVIFIAGNDQGDFITRLCATLAP